MGIALGDPTTMATRISSSPTSRPRPTPCTSMTAQGNFDDARVRPGLAAPTAEMTGFGTNWLDYDNDGRLDLIVGNGAVNIVERLRGQPVPVPSAQSAVPQRGSRSPSRRQRAGRQRVLATGCRARPCHGRCGQRWRRRRGHHQQQRSGPTASEPDHRRSGTRAWSRRALDRDVRFERTVREPVCASARVSASCARGSRRCGDACEPTAAI